MRRIRMIAVVAGLLSSVPAFGQNYATILQPEVEVRSGPSKTFYATSKLKQGERVEIIRESKEAQGWLEIRPPSQSFSWISAKNVHMIDQTRGYVDCDPARPASVLPGSRIVDQPPNRESIKLTPGTAIVVVDRPLTVQGETWLPILPHVNEVRYIPADAVNAATVVAAQTGPASWTLTPQGYTTNSVLAEAEKARAAGDNARARQLYQQVANTATDQNQKVYAMNALSNLPQTNTTQAIPTSLTKTDETRTAFSPSNPAVNLVKLKDAAWSKYGRLYETKLTGDNGQPLYALDAGNGETIYVSTNPGKSLTSYVGRTVCVYGPTMYRDNTGVRLPYILASHVAVP
jgi:uncharacterized protein YgiM (DUF1202 family)